MAKKKNTNLLLPLGIAAGLFFIFKKGKNVDVSGIGKMTKKLHLLQAINNDYQRIKKEKWDINEIYDYVMDVYNEYTTPLFMHHEPLMKGSTLPSGDVNKKSKILIDFLNYNESYILENAKNYFGEKQPLYKYMLSAYTVALEDLFEI